MRRRWVSTAPRPSRWRPSDFSAGLPSPAVVKVTAEKPDGGVVTFDAIVRIDTPTEGRYYENGGILQYVLRDLIKG